VTLWVELKSADGWLREKQKDIRLQLMALGHRWYKVKSFKRFLEVAEEARGKAKK